MDKKTRYIIICILSLLLGACLRYFSSKILYYNLKKEMIGYMDNIKNVRINLSETIFNPLRNEKNETIKTPLNKDLSETYGIYFNPNYIWKDGAVLKNKNVIQDGLSAYVISMAIIHSMQGYYNISKISPCKIYLDKDISLIVKKCKNKHDSLCLILRNSDGKILSPSFTRK